MLKRWFALLLSVILLATALPFAALAETEPTVQAADPTEPTQPDTTQPEEPEAFQVTAAPVPPWGDSTPPQQLRTKAARIQLLRNAIAWDYQNALAQEEADNLFGFCGLLAGYQMYYRGINTWRKSSDGKNHYDEYSAMNMTSGGYIPQAYSVQEYTLEQALNKATNFGSRDVYNILVCFEKTNTQAGSRFGHVVFVYGIIDGTVYFTEGGAGFGKEAGEPMECSIYQFAASYDSWTEFEGIVVLGCRDYLDNCKVYQSDLFASSIATAELTGLPGKADAQVLRTVQKGERLHVIGLYENREHAYYYQIDDGGEIGYVPAESLLPILYLHDTFALEKPSLPKTLRSGQDFLVDGEIQAPGALLEQVCVQILDESGACLQKAVVKASGERFDLGNYEVNQALNFGKLPEGSYTCRVQADSMICAYVGQTVANQIETQTLLEQVFTVGGQELPVEPAQPVTVRQAAQPEKNGWYYENSTWYCYKQGKPCTGWLKTAGVTYYLKEDGSVTTGWATVDGQLRLFTATGALQTGWIADQTGTKYFDKNGHAVVGWYRVDGSYYYFDAQGYRLDRYPAEALRQLRQMGLTLKEIKTANGNK